MWYVPHMMSMQPSKQPHNHAQLCVHIKCKMCCITTYSFGILWCITLYNLVLIVVGRSTDNLYGNMKRVKIDSMMNTISIATEFDVSLHRWVTVTEVTTSRVVATIMAKT